MIRSETRLEVEAITPLDDLERATMLDVLSWIDSGTGLWRIKKPDIPDMHLVAYFVLVDCDHVLLVDHINAELWLPTGGHVEPNEHPRSTVLRELQEELSMQAEFLVEHPILITSTLTVGRTAGHTDVSLWYALKGDRRASYEYDQSEFRSVRWFHKDRIPHGRTDPEMHRFLEKLYSNYRLPNNTTGS